MAINYLNTVNFNKNQLEQAAIQNLTANPASGVLGQVYYNTVASELKICTTAGSPTGAVWTAVGGGVESLTAGTYLTNSGTAKDPVIDHDATSRSNTSVTATPAPGADFTVIDVLSTNPTGHVTYVRTKTVTMPVSDDTTYDLSSAANATSGVDINLTGSDSSTDTINIIGTANEVEIAQTGTANKIQIGLPDDVTVAGNLEVDGEIVQTSSGGENQFSSPFNMNGNEIADLADPTSAQDAATKAYVDSAIVGGLVYQGGYNAATNTPDLDSSPSASIKKGWTYTVTADGLFFTEQVRVGDVLIAESDAPTTLANWTTVQNNIDLASASQVGIGNTAASADANLKGISVSYENPTTGTALVGLNILALTQNDATDDPATNYSIPFYSDPDAENYRITMADLAPVVSAVTSATGTITAGQLSGTVTHAFGINTLVQTIDSSGNTVFCDVSRTATTSVATISVVEANDITILVQKIG